MPAQETFYSLSHFCQPREESQEKSNKKDVKTRTNKQVKQNPFCFCHDCPCEKNLCTREKHMWCHSEWETLNMNILSQMCNKNRNLFFKKKLTRFNRHSAFVFNSRERLDFYYCLSTPHFLLSPWLRTPSPFYRVPSQNSDTSLAVLWSETKGIWMVILKTFSMVVGKAIAFRVTKVKSMRMEKWLGRERQTHQVTTLTTWAHSFSRCHSESKVK